VPDLRSSKFEGQSNFTNPGLQLLNAGMDFQVTPTCRVFTNANYLWFDADAGTRGSLCFKKYQPADRHRFEHRRRVSPVP